MHFRAAPHEVFEALTTPEGRARFWAESAADVDGRIEFRIHNYPPYQAKVLRREPRLLELEYFGTLVRFHLSDSPRDGTVLELSADVDVDDEATRFEMTAGWVSVLMAMKAAVDHGVDLRNHDPELAWEQGFADN